MPDKPLTAYIAGPMRGYPRFNFDAFDEAEADLRRRGYNVISPAQMDRDLGFDPDTHKDFSGQELIDAIRRDVDAVIRADCVVVLKGWEKSTGATTEVAVARWAQKPVLSFPSMVPVDELPQESICQEADRLVSTDRQQDYGHPIDDFTRTGRMWGAVLGVPDVPPEKVGLCMACVKISREVNRPKRDNRVDGCGYLKTVDMIEELRAKRV